ncbi:MAG: LysM peptidoglycan-binding domain-containing protein [Acidobacteriota bacterium]
MNARRMASPRPMVLDLIGPLLRVGLVGLAVLMATGAGAVELTHKVRRGQSASSIARDYYGKLAAGELLLLYNGKTSDVLHPGETLRIPYTAVHTVRPGDSWSAIAQRYLHRPAAYPTIAALNGLSPDRALHVGDRILIPVVFPYALRRGETLSVLADTFLGDQQLSRVLQEFNGIADPRRLSPGQPLEIPIVSLVLLKDARPAAPGPPSRRKSPAVTTPTTAVRATARRPPVPRFTRQLLAAEKAYRRGDYARARRSLTTLQSRVVAGGTTADKTELWRLLTFVYVAFDQNDDACLAYRSLSRSASSVAFDPDLVSPKIRRVVTGCAAG